MMVIKNIYHIPASTLKQQNSLKLIIEPKEIKQLINFNPDL